jgi:prohibitin 2
MAANLLKRLGGPVVGAGLVVGGGVYGVSECIYSVDGGHRAIIFSRWSGISKEIYEPGYHFRMPWLHKPIIFDIRDRASHITSHSGSKNLQMVNIGLRILTKPDARKLPEMYQQLGTNYAERVLPSIMHEVVKSAVAQFNASQLLTQRERVSKLIFDDMKDRLRDFNIIMDDLSITELSFSREYSAANEKKQVALQESLRAQYEVETAKQEAQQKIVQAQGEAKAAQLIGEAVKSNPGFLQLRKIDAAREIASTVAQSANRVYLNADSLLLNVRTENDVSLVGEEKPREL